MINRIYSNPSITNVGQPARSRTATATSAAASTGSFADVYTSAKESASVYTNYTSTGAYVSGARRSSYAPRPIEYTDVKAKRQELDDIVRDLGVKNEQGFFDGMSANEQFAYVYETFAQAFGAGFMDQSWQQFARVDPYANDEEAAQGVLRGDIVHEFYHFLSGWRGVSGEAYEEAFSEYFGYGGMSAEEKYNAITLEYALKGGGTYAASFKMLWLLGQTGAADGDMIGDAMSVLSSKMSSEYASQDMSVIDMMKSRYANAFYAYDADAAILEVVDFIQERNRNTYRPDPNSQDAFNRQDVQDFFKKLGADLGDLGGVLGGMGK